MEPKGVSDTCRTSTPWSILVELDKGISFKISHHVINGLVEN